jgi:SAM-dependent MidA family methyltransferase
MTPSVSLADSTPELCQIITQRITEQPQQRITFAEFMDFALYHPQHGYYSTKQALGGIQDDFFTSPHLGADFGELLAKQFAQMWERLDRPNPFTLVEMGAGQGLLVQDILRYLHRHQFECFEALEYIVIEKSTALIAEQQRRLQGITKSWKHLHWRTWDDIPSQSIVGCCFSNELVDAFPVHQVAIAGGELQEVYVTIGDRGLGVGERGSGFVECLAGLSTPRIAEYFKQVDISLLSDHYPEDYRTEVNLAALDWLATVADRLQRGYLLTIDYGYPAHRYYSPTRSQGTLQCYSQHAHHSDPYGAIGRQDITAHVNFTALERYGEQYGLQTIGFTQQGLFLMALGLGDRIANLSTPDPDTPLQDILRRRESLHALMNPMGLGNFGVLVQAKGLDDEMGRSLQGLEMPG